MTPADALAAECPLRLSPLLHALGHFRHLSRPDGRVCCFRHDAEAPDWPPTDAQAALDLTHLPPA